MGLRFTGQKALLASQRGVSLDRAGLLAVIHNKASVQPAQPMQPGAGRFGANF